MSAPWMFTSVGVVGLCLWKSTSTDQQVVLLATVHKVQNPLSLLCVLTWGETDNGRVRKLLKVGSVGSWWRSVEGEEERCLHHSLWAPCTADQCIRDTALCPHILWHVVVVRELLKVAPFLMVPAQFPVGCPYCRPACCRDSPVSSHAVAWKLQLVPQISWPDGVESIGKAKKLILTMLPGCSRWVVMRCSR